MCAFCISAARFQLSTPLRDKQEPSPTLAINERVNALWAAGQTVYHLGFGASRFPVHPKIQAALHTHGDQRSYLAGLGLRELRSAVADCYGRHYGLPVNADQVIIGPGSKPLYN